MSENKVTGCGESKRQLKTNVTTKSSTSMLGDWAGPPHLSHTGDHTSYTEAESSNSGNAWWEGFCICVIRDIVGRHSSSENEMLSERDAFVDSEPVSDEIHKVLKNDLEMRVSGDGNGDVDTGGNSNPDEAGYARSPASQDLHGESNAVDVWNVVSDDGQGQDDLAELSESVEVREQNSCKETTNSRICVSRSVDVVATVYLCGSENGSTKHLGKEKWEDETGKGSKEESGSVDVGWLVDSVISCVTCPASGETVDDGAE